MQLEVEGLVLDVDGESEADRRAGMRLSGNCATTTISESKMGVGRMDSRNRGVKEAWCGGIDSELNRAMQE